MAPAILIEKMFQAKRFGRKTGVGFYDHGSGPDAEEFVKKAIEETQAETGIKGTSFSFERLILPMINEAAYAVQEKVASPNDVDLAMIMGSGMKKGDTYIADADDAVMGVKLTADELVGGEDRLDRFDVGIGIERKLGEDALVAQRAEDDPFGAGHVERLEALRLDAVEQLVDGVLAGAGFHDDDHGRNLSGAWKRKRPAGCAGLG